MCVVVGVETEGQERVRARSAGTERCCRVVSLRIGTGHGTLGGLRERWKADCTGAAAGMGGGGFDDWQHGRGSCCRCRCNDPTVAGEWECVGNFTDPVSNVTIDRSWDNQFPNFDNTGELSVKGQLSFRHRGKAVGLAAIATSSC